VSPELLILHNTVDCMRLWAFQNNSPRKQFIHRNWEHFIYGKMKETALTEVILQFGKTLEPKSGSSYSLLQNESP